MALRLTEVDYVYSPGSTLAVDALRHVSLDIEPGELALVLGATGSGKSTLLRIAAGLLQPSGGAVELAGAPLTARTARGLVGLVFQDAESQLFADTVLDDVAFGPLNLGLDATAARAAARDALERVGLSADHFGERSPFTLSGGEARRVAIAGVLAMSPKYLLVDEPTAGLDADGRDAVLSVLLEARADAGVVVVSHSAEEFLEHANHVLLLANGRGSWSGPREDLVRCPEKFGEAGLIAPDTLELQRIARARNAWDGPFVLDTAAVVERLTAGMTR